MCITNSDFWGCIMTKKVREKVILAFSGGLDTSFCVPWLKEQGYDVITVFVNTAGFTTPKLGAIAKRAHDLGAVKHANIPAEKDLYEKIVSYLIKANGLYQGIYPQLCGDRYIIVEKCIEVARRERTQNIAHGCTAMGNDQIRFDVSIQALGDYRIIAPIRDIQNTASVQVRDYEIDYLRKRGFSIVQAHHKYSINQNMLGVTISGSEIDRYDEPSEEAFVLTKTVSAKQSEYITIQFEHGMPVALNGKKLPGALLLKTLNGKAAAHGIGRFIYTGDCIIGIKGRIVFECPGLHTLLVAHKALEDAVLTKEQNQLKNLLGQKWAHLVYSGLYFDPLRNDIEQFLDSQQTYVTGTVTVKLHNGTAVPVKYSSPYILQEKDTVYAQTAAWQPHEAEGYIKLFGMSTVLASKRM
ncbi:MAG: argininosuccinate synthase [Candidatus Fischerbacteria bacterium RBG_13_37_8]|uniref:argininosuccinate synthase n=1 Tax=Candidatus Fischerbacteria bacterium RBG_13_37_8 TaxID=1817863 RepID=A0A1F5VTY0_9BACT|nr:MAG: argininosuccinate synthase [Candidatus Fischerbacteria bacterium RBG_13_37_8]